MLAGELNREYSVLKSSLDESMNAPPIMGNCAAIKDRSMVSLLAWLLLLLPALQYSSLLLLSSLSPLWVQPPAQLSGSGRNSEQVPSGPGDRDLNNPGVVALLQPSRRPR